MYPPGVKRLFDHLQPSQVRNVASLLAQALILQCHLYKHWGILYLWTGEEKDDRG